MEVTGDDEIPDVAWLGTTPAEMLDWMKTDTWPVPPALCNDDFIDLFLSHIGSASTLGLAEKTLVTKLMHMLMSRIVSRDLSSKHVDLLGAFLAELVAKDDYAMQLRVLGRGDLVRRGAPSKDEEVRWWMTREVFEWRIRMGGTDDEALYDAWDTWYVRYGGDRPHSFEAATRTDSKEVWSNGRPKSMYDQQVEMLKSRLNKAGSRTPAKRGRKPGIK